MDYRIVEKPSFTVVGKAIRVGTKAGENMRIIPQFWRDSAADGTLKKVRELAAAGTTLGNVTLGICSDFATDMSEFTYMIAAEGSSTPDGMVELSVPAAIWAVFDSIGPMPDAIQSVWGRIWGEFFTDAPYAHGAGPDFERYPPGDSMAADYVCEVWIPVVAK